MKKLLIIASALFLVGCLGMPRTMKPVSNFNIDKYLGKWYEVARLDHSFERGLTNVTADYSLRSDGGIKVVNTGFNQTTNKSKTAEGKAFFVDSPTVGYMKVSFFGPFYGSYVVFTLDDDYQYAFVSGPNVDYLWLLSRTPTVKPFIKNKFLQQSKQFDYDISKLIWVDHKDQP